MAVAVYIGDDQQIGRDRQRSKAGLGKKWAGEVALACGQPALVALGRERIEVAAQQSDDAAFVQSIADHEIGNAVLIKVRRRHGQRLRLPGFEC